MDKLLSLKAQSPKKKNGAESPKPGEAEKKKRMR